MMRSAKWGFVAALAVALGDVWTRLCWCCYAWGGDAVLQHDALPLA